FRSPGAGEAVDGVIDVLNYVPQPRTIRMDPERVNALLGTDISPVDMYQYLERVNIITEKKDFPNGPADVIVPSWRGDVEGIADLAEEVARFYGYNKIPTTLMRGQTTLGIFTPEQKLENRLGELCRACGYSEIITYSFLSPPYYDKILWPGDSPARQGLKIPTTLMRGQTTLGIFTPEQKLENRLGELCRACGYSEIITYSFISPTYYDKILWPGDYAARKSFKILNPLGEDTSIMRTTTLPSMLEILTRNWNYRNKSARLYEVGRIYLSGGENGRASETKVLTLGGYGEDMDFYAMKCAIEAILKDIRAKDVHFEGPSGAPSDASYHPGRCATVWSGSDCIGVFGQIH